MIAKSVPEKKVVPVKNGEGHLVLRGDDFSCPGSSTSSISPTLSNSKNFK